jgi:hypothetical protein
MEEQGPESSKRLDPNNWILSVRQESEAYHSQKEQLVFGTIVLSLTGAIALIVKDPDVWSSTSPPPKVVQLLFLAISGTLAFLFVLRQLGLQQVADIKVTACDRLIHKWLTTPPDPTTELIVEKRGDRLAPKALLDSVDAVKAEREWKWEWQWFWAKWLKHRPSAVLVCATLLLFDIMAIYRMIA